MIRRIYQTLSFRIECELHPHPIKLHTCQKINLTNWPLEKFKMSPVFYICDIENNSRTKSLIWYENGKKRLLKTYLKFQHNQLLYSFGNIMLMGKVRTSVPLPIHSHKYYHFFFFLFFALYNTNQQNSTKRLLILRIIIRQQEPISSCLITVWCFRETIWTLFLCTVSLARDTVLSWSIC